MFIVEDVAADLQYLTAHQGAADWTRHQEVSVVASTPQLLS